MERWYGVGLCKYQHTCCIENNEKKEIKSEHDIIQIIFKCRESEMYVIVLLPHYKRMYNQIDLIKK